MRFPFEALAPLCAGAALLSGCGGAPAPVNSAEVPAATEAKPSSGPVPMGETPKPAVSMGETPKPPALPVPMGETPKPVPSAKAP